MNPPTPSIEWHTIVKGKDGGTQFHTGDLVEPLGLDRRIVVRRVFWAKPGFKNVRSTGWVVFIDGKQFDGMGAMPTARAARQHAELPGVWAAIQTKLGETS